MKPQIEMSTLVAASPLDVYAAWLDSIGHAAMTGGSAADAKPEIGAPFTAWDGYIRGVTLELEPGRRIVQAWRTTEFPDHAPDSRLEVLLLPEGDGTRVMLRHAAIPEDQVESYRGGWESYYFEPMQKHFSSRKGKGAKKPAAKKPAAKKSAPKAVAKKSAPKKPIAKKPAAKKPVAKKSSAKKTVAKKSSAKKSARKSK